MRCLPRTVGLETQVHFFGVQLPPPKDFSQQYSRPPQPPPKRRILITEEVFALEGYNDPDCRYCEGDGGFEVMWKAALCAWDDFVDVHSEYGLRKRHRSIKGAKTGGRRGTYGYEGGRKEDHG